MSERDDVSDELGRSVRTLMASGARLGQSFATMRQQRERQVAVESRDRSTEMTRRLEAERALAHRELAVTGDQEWWSRATPDLVAEQYQRAVAWSEVDQVAADARARIETEVQNRFGIDPRTLGGQEPGPMLRAAADRLAHDADQDRAQVEAALQEADAADQSIGAAGKDGPDHTPGRDAEAERERDDAAGEAEIAYDSAERREAEAAALIEAGVGTDAVEAKTLADTANAHPADRAPAGVAGKKATKARKGRGSRTADRERTQPLTR